MGFPPARGIFRFLAARKLGRAHFFAHAPLPSSVGPNEIFHFNSLKLFYCALSQENILSFFKIMFPEQENNIFDCTLKSLYERKLLSITPRKVGM